MQMMVMQKTIKFCEEIVSANQVVTNHDPLEVSSYDCNDLIETGKHFLIDFSRSYDSY
jgi:hypothetical protein